MDHDPAQRDGIALMDTLVEERDDWQRGVRVAEIVVQPQLIPRTSIEPPESLVGRPGVNEPVPGVEVQPPRIE